MKSFKNIMGASDDLNKRIEKIKQNVIKDPDVKEFLEQHQSQLTNAMIDEDLNVYKSIKINRSIMMVIVLKNVLILLKGTYLSCI